MLKRLFILSLALAPMVTLAADNTFSGAYFSQIIEAIAGWITALVPLLIGLAVVVLFFGIVKYIWGGAEDQKQAKNLMIWGVIAIAVMVSIWGLVGLLQDFTGIDSVNSIEGKIPEVPKVDPV